MGNFDINKSGGGQTGLVKEFASGLGSNLVGKFFGRGIHVLSQILLANWLGPASFGLFSIGWNILRVIGVVAPLGMDIGILQFGAKQEKGSSARSALVITAVVISAVSGLVFGLVFWLLSPGLAAVFHKPDLATVLRVIVIAFPLNTLLRTSAAATRIDGKMAPSIWAEELGQPISNLFLLITLNLYGLDVLGAAWASTASFGIGAGIGVIFNRFSFKRSAIIGMNKDQSRDLLRYSLPAAFATMFGSMILLTDRIFVGVFLSEEDTGVYQAISLFSVLFVTILVSINLIAAPMVARYFAANQHQELKKLYSISTKWVLHLCFPFLILIWVFPQSVIGSIYRESYVVGATTLVILAMAQLLNVLSGPVDQVLIMTGNQKDMLRITATVFVSNVIVNIVLVPIWGLNGAAVATLIAFGSISSAGLYFVWRRIRVWPYDRSIWKVGAASGLAILVAVLLRGQAISQGLLGLILSGLGIAGVYFGVIFVLGLDKEEKELLGMVSGRLQGN